jgi:CPA2 family monovalent cation:H+ antiporter-2
MEHPLPTDILIILGLSVAVLLVCHRARLPLLVGLIVTGMVVGPHGLKLIRAVDEVRSMAQIGVVLLLFTIGLDFSFRRLLSIRKLVLLGGTIQVGLTLAAGFLFGLLFRCSVGEAVFIGFLISLSSTAIVLKILQERAEIDSPHGRTVLGILIFQDLAVVPMMLITPLVAGISKEGQGLSLLLLVLEGGLILGGAFLAGKYVVPRILYLVARTRDRELFVLTVLVICLGVAAITYQVGLSLALGAFLAGLIISESDYSHHALGSILPFRDVFASIFFISIGMLLNLGFLVQNIGVILAIAMGLLILKALLATAATLVLALPLRTAILAGLALAQIGEFSFVLAEVGVAHGLLPGPSYQVFLAAIVLTMLATPAVISISPRLAYTAAQMLWLGNVRRDPAVETPETQSQVENHIVIVGFGVSGRRLAESAKNAGLKYVIVETNPETVKHEKTKGQTIYYGDATHAAVLSRAHVARARLIAVAINDSEATKRIIQLAHRMNPAIQIVVRAKFLSQSELLLRLGADEVVTEEVEASVELCTRVLARYLVPKDEIDKLVDKMRTERNEHQ